MIQMDAIGKGVKQDDSMANKYFQKAVEFGDPNALCYLGCNYRDGIGIKKDYSKAIECFKKAAEFGHELAKNNLNDLQKQKKK